MKGIKNITNKITKAKDSASKVIAYSHLSKVISCFLDGPKTKGKPIIFKKKGGPQNRRQLMFVKKEKKPQNTKGGTQCSQNKKKNEDRGNHEVGTEDSSMDNIKKKNLV